MWQQIVIGDCDSAVPAKVKKAHAALTADLERLEKQRAEIGERIRAAKAADLSQSTVAEMAAIKMARLTAWQSEMSLRQAFDEWIDVYTPALRKVQEDAFSAVVEAEASVRSMLESIGYVSMDKHEMGAGKITPGMIHVHPTVLRANSRCRDLEAAFGVVFGWKRQNDEERQRTLQEMNRIRSELTAVA